MIFDYPSKLQHIVLTIVTIVFITSCGGDSPTTVKLDVPNETNNDVSPASCLPDLSIYEPNTNKPIITLLGSKIEIINIGDTYFDSGALAENSQGIDISDKVETFGIENINTNVIGDYIVRYEASDNSQNSAFPAYRFIRVIDGQASNDSKRLFMEIDAAWEYIEHLPIWFGADNDERFPLLIVNHGWFHSKRFDQSGKMNSMDRQSMVNYIRSNDLDESLPFIILTPQRCWSDVGSSQIAIMDSFIEWAKRNYPVDEKRVYMTGLSMGGWATWEYARFHSDKLAAASPMSGPGDNSQICGVTTPIWAFAAKDDSTVSYLDVKDTYEALFECESLIQPKLTLFLEGGHVIDDNVFDLSYLNEGSSSNDIYVQSLFDWFLEHKLE